MIVWQGWGILVVVLAIVPIIVMQLLADGLMGPGGWSRNNSWLLPVALLIAAPLIYFVGKRLNEGQERVLVDPQTGQEVRIRRTHSLFWVRMEYWAAIVAVIAVVAFIAGLF